MSSKLPSHQDLGRVRARLVAHLQETVGSALTAEAAQVALEQAKGWSPSRARELARHLADHPAALTAPSPHCPASLVRLLHILDAAGHGEAVTKLACASCGRTDPLPLCSSPQGRRCGWCQARTTFRTCDRCGREGQIVTHRRDGAICRRCYRNDPVTHKECADCERVRFPYVRLDDGKFLCITCRPRPFEECVGCGRPRPVAARTPDGPVCGACYKSPARPCGICGQLRSISSRATGNQPDICYSCYRKPRGECSVCGRVRHGGRVGARGGAFHCQSCWPRPRRTCGICGQTRTATALWPLGPVCSGCYQRRRKTPAACSSCGISRILIGRTPTGDGLCASCCGRDDPASRCRDCDTPGDLIADGLCPRCALKARVRDLLSSEDGAMPTQLVPLAEALTNLDNPYPALAWLRGSQAARMLTQMAADPSEFTHEVLDALPQNKASRFLRGVMITAGVLPRRHEHLARLELWMAHMLRDIPPHHSKFIRPFAEWGILRDARRRAARGRYTVGASKRDIREIRTALGFLAWLDENGADLSAVDQELLDLWLTTHPTKRDAIVSFVRWTVARRLTGPLDLPRRKGQHASTFLDEDDHHQQLRRCLNDETLPRDLRIIGALVRLYALPVSRIVELTTDRFRHEADRAYLTLDRHPVLLPPKLAKLIEEHITQDATTARLSRELDGGAGYLLPGGVPGRPRNPLATAAQLVQYDLPVRAARNTAMIEAVKDLPPTVVADLFGLHPQTTHRWAAYANDTWADYLAARQCALESREGL